MDAGKLWAGGLATAGVAALTATVGILIARGVLGIPVLAPKGDGVWGNASTAGYALGAGVSALVATALLQALAATTPNPSRFFSWIMSLVTTIATVLPLTLDVPTAARVATAAINLVLGIAITTTLNAIARTATRTG
jgi:Family of unknown function (DUF6069)